MAVYQVESTRGSKNSVSVRLKSLTSLMLSITHVGVVWKTVLQLWTHHCESSVIQRLWSRSSQFKSCVDWVSSNLSGFQKAFLEQQCDWLGFSWGVSEDDLRCFGVIRCGVFFCRVLLSFLRKDNSTLEETAPKDSKASQIFFRNTPAKGPSQSHCSAVPVSRTCWLAEW